MFAGSENCLQSCYLLVKNTLFSSILPIHYKAQFLNAFEKIYLIVFKDETSLQLKINVYT